MARMRCFAWLLSALVVTAGLPSTASAQGRLHLESETIFRFFEQERPDGEDKKGFPAYEYLRLDLGNLGVEGLSAHAYGWGRYDFGDYYDDSAAGEFLYGYVQYASAVNNILARLGRQYVFGGVANDSVDGLSFSAAVTPYGAVSLYAGQPVSLEEVNGRSGDSIWGGRISHHLGTFYDVGLSYKRLKNDGDKQEEFLGIDASVTPPLPISFYGMSKRDLTSDQWAEHSYEARVSLFGVRLRPFFQRFDFGAYFNTGANTATVFDNPVSAATPLKDSGLELNTGGADLSWAATSAVELGAKVQRYDYNKEDREAWYYAGLITLHGTGLTQVGAEAGRMDGKADEDKYTLLRAHAYWESKRFYVSGDAMYVSYDEDINGESKSLFASLGGGTKVWKTLKLKASADYSKDPYFDKDFRGLVAAEFAFDVE